MNSLKKLLLLIVATASFCGIGYNLVWSPDWQIKRWPDTQLRAIYIEASVKDALSAYDPSARRTLESFGDRAPEIENDIFKRLLLTCGLTALITASISFLPFLIGIGKKNRHLRGSRLVTQRVLKRMLFWRRLTGRENRKTLAVFSAYFMIGVVLSGYLALKTGALSSFLAVVVAVVLFFLLQTLSTDGSPKKPPVRIGGVPLPESVLGTHFLIEGTTGSGKSQCIYGMISDARSRGDRGLIMDIAGACAKRFAKPGDLHLTFGENSSLHWNPFLEIRSAFDYAELARAAIPDGHGDSAPWHDNARMLFQTCLKKLDSSGEHSLHRLMYWVNNAPLEELAPFIKDTEAAVFAAEGNSTVLQNTRSVAVRCLQSWAFLPDKGDFSIRDWVRNAPAGQWLFVHYRDDQIAAIRQLLACWMQLAITETLSLDEDKTVPTWVVADEFDSLGQVSVAKDALSKLRRFNGRCLFGVQTVAQPQATYGRELAQVLFSCLSTKLYLRAGDPDTAEYCSKSLGDLEIERSEESRSRRGLLGLGGDPSRSAADRHVTQRLVLPSEIEHLPNLEGYLSIAGDLPITKVKIPFVS